MSRGLRLTSSQSSRLLEGDVLPCVLEALQRHPKVAWAQRVNKGFGRLERWQNKSLSPPMAWGYKHALDITGQMRDGRRLEVEVKKPGKSRHEPLQKEMIEAVNGARGVAFTATGVEDVFRELANA